MHHDFYDGHLQSGRKLLNFQVDISSVLWQKVNYFWKICEDRSCRLEVFYKKTATLFKSRLSDRFYPANFAEFLRNCIFLNLCLGTFGKTAAFHKSVADWINWFSISESPSIGYSVVLFSEKKWLIS